MHERLNLLISQVACLVSEKQAEKIVRDTRDDNKSYVGTRVWTELYPYKCWLAWRTIHPCLLHRVWDCIAMFWWSIHSCTSRFFVFSCLFYRFSGSGGLVLNPFSELLDRRTSSVVFWLPWKKLFIGHINFSTDFEDFNVITYSAASSYYACETNIKHILPYNNIE